MACSISLDSVRFSEREQKLIIVFVPRNSSQARTLTCSVRNSEHISQLADPFLPRTSCGSIKFGLRTLRPLPNSLTVEYSQISSDAAQENPSRWGARGRGKRRGRPSASNDSHQETGGGHLRKNKPKEPWPECQAERNHRCIITASTDSRYWSATTHVALPGLESRTVERCTPPLNCVFRSVALLIIEYGGKRHRVRVRSVRQKSHLETLASSGVKLIST